MIGELDWLQIARTFNFQIRNVERLAGGRNNRLYRVAVDDGTVILKHYAVPDGLGRDRRRTEYDAITFLTRHGVTSVPRPVATDATLNVAVYSDVPGTRPAGSAIDASLVDQMADFIAHLRRLARSDDSGSFGPASEAFFTAGDLAQNLRRRLARLERIVYPAPDHGLSELIETELRPSALVVIRQLEEHVPPSTDVPLRRELRTLSPSDIGFHNVLVNAAGGAVFLDFEYFGWDDPAKLLSDFLTQHDIELRSSLGSRFLSQMLDIFGEDDDLPRRLASYFPLFRVQKAIIALNEFLPAEAERRHFAVGDGADAVVVRQVSVARSVLDRVLPSTVYLGES